MLYFLATDYQWRSYHLFLASWGKQLANRVRVISYDRLFRTDRIPVGSYVFCDIELLSPVAAETAVAYWRALASSGHELRLLNDPLRVMRRYELLRELHERGINDFDVYRLTEARRPKRYPVFIRGENDHRSPETGLLHGPEELEAEIEKLTRQGKSRDTRIITEFLPTRDERGLYRKFGAFMVGGRIIPRHVIYGRDWVVKGQGRVVDAAIAAEELSYVTDNPHEAQLREIFALAHIDYGRIDYTMVDGSIQVFEINTNPQTVKPGPSHHPERTKIKSIFSQNYIAALESLDCQAPAGRKVAVGIKRKPLLKRRPPIVELLLAIARRIGLARYEPVIHLHLWRWRSRWQ